MKNTFSIQEALSFGWRTFWAKPWFWLIAWVISYGLAMGGNSFGNSNNNNSSTNYTNSPQNNIINDAVSKVETDVLGQSTVNNIAVSGSLDKPTVPSMYTPVTTAPSTDNTAMWAVIGMLGVLFGIPLVIAALIFMVLKIIAGTALQLVFIHLTLDTVRNKAIDYKTLLSDVNPKKIMKFLTLGLVYGLMVFFGFLFFIIPGIYLVLTYSFAAYIMIDKNTGIRESLKLSAELTKGNKMKLLGYSFVSFFIAILGLLAFFIGVFPATIITMLAFSYIYTQLSGENIKNNIAKEVVAE